MRVLRWIVILAVAALVFAFLHYNLPQRDVVRVVNTEVSREDLSNWNRVFYSSGDSGAARIDSRDIRFIQAVRPDGEASVYRNEDTGLFGWPPYFKTDSQDLQTEAADYVSGPDDPRWVVVTHYGWRSNWLSIYPNALAIREVSGPDAVGWFPWLPLLVLAAIALALFLLARLVIRIKDRVFDPAVDRTVAGMQSFGDRVRGWFRR